MVRVYIHIAIVLYYCVLQLWYFDFNGLASSIKVQCYQCNMDTLGPAKSVD